jgi:hypothetical protein
VDVITILVLNAFINNNGCILIKATDSAIGSSRLNMANLRAWYSKKASATVEITMKRWNLGVKVEDIFPVFAMKHLLLC